MDIFNFIITRLFDALLYPFRTIHPVWGLAAVSVLTGAVMVWIFGKVSNQKRIRELKTEIKGRLLEMWLFRDNTVVVLKAQFRTFWLTAKYALWSLLALVVLMVPVTLIMIQLHARYGHEPLRPGEDAIVTITYAKPVNIDSMEVTLKPANSFVVETPALRVPEKREVSYRIRAESEGHHELLVNVLGKSTGKKLYVGQTGLAISPLRSGHWFDRLLNPSEPSMPECQLASIEVRYPPRELSLLGMQFHWLWPFFILSIVAGFALKGFFGVEL